MGEKRQCSAPRIVAIDLKPGGHDRPHPGAILARKLIEAARETLAGDAVGEVHSKKVERLRRKIGTKVSAITPDRAVIHQPIFEEHLLSEGNVGGSEDHRA